MTDNRLSELLEHIRGETRNAMQFVDGMDKSAFLANALVQRAVTMCLINIGEEATKIMDRYAAFAEAHPEVPWHRIRGMRNQIAHGYFDLDLDAIWTTTQTDLPALLERLPAAAE